ncbi:hypothetical protein [Knoellia koreensis]|uniref:Uncharacterized protein n=1 Tax=Knoellia koreensis TaxID=2730921 RepID=A0A849HJ66_9MICO|nr:hypothetical protein [Knoellia sp. DB2414S]NNM47312.1 hypothetical protein [Knoellia sp. DB2414S]
MGGHDGGMDTSPTPTTDDAVGALLTAAAPPTPPIATERAAGLARAVAQDVVESDRTLAGRARRLRRRHKVAAAGAAAAIVLVPTGAWAAEHFLAQTGRFGNPVANPDFEDRSEFINLCAKDFPAYVRTLAPTDLPAAPGKTWDGYAAGLAEQWAAGAGCAPSAQADMQSTSLRLDLLAAASADWGCALVWATEDGRTAQARTARTAMLDLDAAARRLATIEGSVGTQDPDTFLANSRLPQWVGCPR